MKQFLFIAVLTISGSVHALSAKDGVCEFMKKTPLPNDSRFWVKSSDEQQKYIKKVGPVFLNDVKSLCGTYSLDPNENNNPLQVERFKNYFGSLKSYCDGNSKCQAAVENYLSHLSTVSSTVSWAKNAKTPAPVPTPRISDCSPQVNSDEGIKEDGGTIGSNGNKASASSVSR